MYKKIKVWEDIIWKLLFLVFEKRRPNYNMQTQVALREE